MQQNEWDYPPPPGVEPVSGPHTWRWIILTLVTGVLLVVALVVPIPVFYEFIPGPIDDVEALVHIDGASTYSSEGELYLTTVRVKTEVTFYELVSAAIDSEKSIVLREDFTGGLTTEEVQHQQEIEMTESKTNAQIVALGELGLADPEGEGARVESIVPGSPAEGALRAGDVIVEIDDSTVPTACDVTAILGRYRSGDDVSITVRRGSSLDTVRATLTESPDGSSVFLGVALTDVGYEFNPDLDITIETGEIGGPSAGLMFALAVYDRLTPGDLTGGRSIAGTGTIGCDGSVGPIGGVGLKVIAAERAGAEVFLAPDGDFDEARDAAGEIEVLSISDFDEALSGLEGLD